MNFQEKDWLSCCGSTRFAKEMASASPFSSLDHAVSTARDIWFNKVDVNGWLEAFAAHPQIGQWSKGEQSTAISTATNSILQELADWNAQYRQKFGFIFLIFASGRSSAEILLQLKKRYENRPIVEFEIAAQEQMKVTELRLAKLFSTTTRSELSSGKASQVPTRRTRPPITTHILDVSRGLPAADVEVLLEMWQGTQARPSFGERDVGGWVYQGSSTTNADGRSGELMSIVDAVNPGIYRISFNTGKYNQSGFFPYVSIVFEINESQKLEHFHVPLLLSPFSFSTYRGS
ncbi:Uric acid degradation bifunctional protein TTL [Linum perenne]